MSMERSVYRRRPDLDSRARRVRRDSPVSIGSGTSSRDGGEDRSSPRPVGNIADWAKQYALPVCSADSSLLAYAQMSGWRVHPTIRGYNAHGVSHLARDVALLSILEVEGRDCLTLKILDFFGSNRNRKFEPQSKGPILAMLDGRRTRDVLDIKFHNAPDLVIQGDAPRLGGTRREPLGDDYDFCVIQDVYEGVDPHVLLDLCDRTHRGVVYLIVRQFRGYAGSDVLALPDGSLKKEHVWIRDADGLVHGSPDPFTDPYPAHPALDFLTSRSQGGLDITPQRTVGPYRVFKVARTPDGAVPITPVIPLANGVELLFLKPLVPKSWFLGKWLYWSLTDLKHRELLVHMPTYAALAAKYAIRLPRGHVLDSALAAVESSVRSDPCMAQVAERFPRFFLDILKGTQAAVLYSDRDENVKQLHDLRVGNRENESILEAVRAVATPVAASWWAPWNWFKRIGLLGLGWTFRKPLCTAIAAAAKAFWVSVRRPLSFLSYLGGTVASTLSSVGFEEICRFVYPSVFYKCVLPMEILTCAGRYGFYTAAKSLLAHMGLAALSILPYGIILCPLVHLMYNVSTLDLAVISPRVDEFLSLYSKGMSLSKVCEVKSQWFALPGGTWLPALQTTMRPAFPEGFRGSVEVHLDGRIMGPEEALELVSDDYLPRPTIYPIAITNAMMWAPANSDANLLVAIGQRLHADPFGGTPESSDRHEAWRVIARKMIRAGFFDGTVSHVPDLQECARLMGNKKGRRLLAADLERLMGAGRDRHSKSVFVKTNETLNLKGQPGILKPRAITNLDPAVHAMQAPWSRVVADLLHQDLRATRVYEMAGVPFRLIFASGFSPRELEESVQKVLLSRDTGFFVSGDDSFMIWGSMMKFYKFIDTPFGEADLSKADHSQDEGPLVHFTQLIQAAWQLPTEYTSVRTWSCGAPYTAKGKRVFIRGSTAMQLPTGTTDTTTLNSTTSAAMCCHFVSTGQHETFENTSKELGLTQKYIPRDRLSDATFLKGWFFPHRLGINHGVYHLPLPSMILKVGKVMTNPTLITKKFGSPKDDPVTAIRKVASAIVKSHSKIPSDYPVVGRFLAMLRRCGLDSDVEVPTESYNKDKWRAVEQAHVSRSLVVDSVLDRYKVSLEDILRVENLFDSVDVLPAYIEDPFFDVLLEVDY